MSEGKLTHVEGRFALRFERELRHPVEKVWRALIEPAELKAWFPAAIEGKREAGAHLRFVFEGDAAATLTGSIRTFEPPTLLEYSWGEDILRWELTRTGKGCLLVFTHILHDRSAAPRDAGGWEHCLDALQRQLGDLDLPARGAWPALYQQHLAAFGFGAFPRFFEDAGLADPGDTLPSAFGTRHTFTGRNGAAAVFSQAESEAEVPEYGLGGEGYVLVIAGAYTLRMAHAPDALTLAAGQEFHVPGGVRLLGKVAAGTRLVHVRAEAEGAAASTARA